jgi:LuxR family maltose regulon positive regulatory protein
VADAYWWLENEGVGPLSPADFPRERGLLVLARLYLAEQRADEALALLARLLSPAELAGRNGSILEISLLQALALAQQQRSERAQACLRRALSLAEPEQYVRIFLDEGRPLAQLLQQLTPRSPYASRLLAQMESPAAADRLPEPLTNRELEILALVARGASNQEVASELVITVGTVKGHLNHVLGKLGARNRTEAVARARELYLL